MLYRRVSGTYYGGQWRRALPDWYANALAMGTWSASDLDWIDARVADRQRLLELTPAVARLQRALLTEALEPDVYELRPGFAPRYVASDDTEGVAVVAKPPFVFDPAAAPLPAKVKRRRPEKRGADPRQARLGI